MNPIICNKCKVKMKIKSKNGDKTYTCPHCGKQFFIKRKR